MSCPPPPPDEEPASTSKANKKPTKKKKVSIKRFNELKKVLIRNQSQLATTMSSWAEHFTAAANWQQNHQLDYWKAKATSLEHDNKMLRNIIRKNHIDTAIPVQSSSSESEEEISDVNPNMDSDDELEVSEEYIAFLRGNAKYKEDARREREKLKARYLAEEDSVEQVEVPPPPTHEEEIVTWKELYGDKWQNIAALEMSLQSDFIQQRDNAETAYWPNIPLNL